MLRNVSIVRLYISDRCCVYVSVTENSFLASYLGGLGVGTCSRCCVPMGEPKPRLVFVHSIDTMCFMSLMIPGQSFFMKLVFLLQSLCRSRWPRGQERT